MATDFLLSELNKSLAEFKTATDRMNALVANAPSLAASADMAKIIAFMEEAARAAIETANTVDRFAVICSLAATAFREEMKE